MSIFKCKMCGGTLEINTETVATCEHCGTQQTLPKISDDKKANMYDRANHFRRNNEFDKAMGIYEQILNEDNTDAETYWSLVLCRYGIEYVEDPVTRKRVPTVNRAQFTSVYDDDNYKSALQYADMYQKAVYEQEAKAINEIQKGILAISQKEEPFDVFICYKETDNNGRRTPDSVLANDLYHQLTQEGFKVFFSRITLEDKLGSAYEPYIFAALNSAKVMVVLGTRPEYFNAVWVKNEWSRYLALIRQGQKKMLIPAYKDIDPYDLPDEFSHLQAQDMSKLGFMQDLIRGIKKIVSVEEEKNVVVKETVVTEGNTNITPLLKRVSIFLEDGKWESADEYCEKVLDIDPECAEAYLGKLMAEMHVKKREDLKNYRFAFDNNEFFIKVIRYGDESLKKELQEYIDCINYRNAITEMNEANSSNDYMSASKLFEKTLSYKDSELLKAECDEKYAKLVREELFCSMMNSANCLEDYSKIVVEFKNDSEYELKYKNCVEQASKKIEQDIKAIDSQDKCKKVIYRINESMMSELKDEYIPGLQVLSDVLSGKEPEAFNSKDEMENKVASILRIAYICLGGSKWKTVIDCCNRAIEINSESADIYLCKLMAELQVNTQQNICNTYVYFEQMESCQMVFRYGNEDTIKHLKYCLHIIKNRNDKISEEMYIQAVRNMELAYTDKDFNSVISELERIIDYKDSKELIQKCLESIEKEKRKKKMTKLIVIFSVMMILAGVGHLIFSPVIKYNMAVKYFNEGQLEKSYDLCESLCKKKPYKDCEKLMFEIEKEWTYQEAIELLNNGKYDEASAMFRSIYGYKDSVTYQKETKYQKAKALLKEGKYNEAIAIFRSLIGYKDSDDFIK